MQQVQQRELPERISWARALIFGVGYFFIAAILIGQLPGYIFNASTASSLEEFEHGSLSLGLICLASFAIIQVIMLLFDPKPVIPPVIVVGLGAILSVAGVALSIWAPLTGNQYFPKGDTSIAPLLGGKFLWFQPNAVDFLMVGLVVLLVGLAMVFYGILALGELRNPDRRDLGVTPAMRWMIVLAIVLLIVFLYGYTYMSSSRVAQIVVNVALAISIFLALGAFGLRLHYLMRPVRKSTMAGLYAIGALGLAQIGAILILAWLLVYPAIAWIHSWSFIGLGTFLTVCTRTTAIPASCSFSADAGYLIDAIVTTNFFIAMLAAVWAWRSNRNLVVIGSVVITAVIALTALLMHTGPSQLPTAMMICAGALILAVIWSSVARREFAVVGESNLGCLGMWLVVGTCLFVYIACFALFSVPLFASEETPPNIPAPPNGTDAIVVLALFGVLAAIQFYFLIRNRYKV
jgi:hypothetical protein